MMKDIPLEKNRMKYVAFLRGINVGGHTLVKMEELRKAFESLGFRNVRTVLTSGNVIFEAPGENTTTLSRKIALKLLETLGREILVIVRSLDDLQELEARQPFKCANVTPGTRLFVTFISENAKPGNIHGLSTCDGFQILSVSNGIICSVLEEQPGVGAVHLMGAIEKELGRDVTTRTWNTITRILKVGNN
jgi:uncharacterized protein (DUF1697 family)